MESWVSKNNSNMLEVLCNGDTSYEAREKAERLLIDFDRVLSRIYEKNAMRHWRTYVDGHNRLLERMDQRAGILDKAGRLMDYPTWSEDDEA